MAAFGVNAAKEGEPMTSESIPELGCPHGRPSWRMCPHCLGINNIAESTIIPYPKMEAREPMTNESAPDDLYPTGVRTVAEWSLERWIWKNAKRKPIPFEFAIWNARNPELAAKDAEIVALKAERDAAVAAAYEDAAKCICQFCDSGVPYDDIGHHENERHCYAHYILKRTPSNAKRALDTQILRARLEMYESLVHLPIKGHEGPCTPESGCDAACADTAAFSDYIVELRAELAKLESKQEETKQ